jgi:hypothetical protein
MTTSPSDEDVHVRPFADFLREQARGTSHEELSETLHQLVARVQDTGKKGALTYTVSVEPMKGDPNTLVISDEIKVKLPEHDRQASTFFTDKDGNLTRDDPRQPHLPMRVAGTEGDTPIREVR